jgi:hypothetical protein
MDGTAPLKPKGGLNGPPANVSMATRFSLLCTWYPHPYPPSIVVINSRDVICINKPGFSAVVEPVSGDGAEFWMVHSRDILAAILAPVCDEGTGKM